LLQLPPAGCSRPSLGSESAGMMRHSSSSVVDLPLRPQSRVAVVRKARPTVNICSPDTSPSPKTTVAYVCAIARVGYGGVYPGRGQMSSTSSDDDGA